MSNSRSKAIKRSSLEDIEGIGPAKAKALLSLFKTISKIKEANVEEITAVRGISVADAERIVGHFNKN